MSKHRTGLQRGRYDKVAHPKFFNTQNLPEDNEDFLARNEAAQAEQLRNFDEGEFWTNYQLLQAFDFISLFLCNKDVVDDYIEPVPTSYDGKSDPIRLTVKTDRRAKDRDRPISVRCKPASGAADQASDQARRRFPIPRRSARLIFRRRPRPSISSCAPDRSEPLGICGCEGDPRPPVWRSRGDAPRRTAAACARPGQVLVEVKAAGVNLFDTQLRSGLYKRELPLTLGLEGAGVVCGHRQ